MKYSKQLDASGYLIRLIQDIQAKPSLYAAEIESDLKVLLGKIKSLETELDKAEDNLENL